MKWSSHHSLNKQILIGDKKLTCRKNYSRYRQEFMLILELFSDMWDGLWGRMTSQNPVSILHLKQLLYTRHYIEKNQKSANFSSSISLGFSNKKTSNQSQLDGLHQLCLPRKNGILPFYADYRELNALTQRENPIQYRERMSSPSPSRNQLSFPH